MAYAAIVDLNAYFPSIDFDSNTSITDVEALRFLEEDSEYIDGRISKVVSLTDITTFGLLVLRQINAMRTAAKIDGALPYFNTRSEDEEKKMRDLREQADDLINQIEVRKLIISNSLKGTVSGLLASEETPVTFFTKETVF